MNVLNSELYVNDLTRAVNAFDVKEIYGKNIVVTGGLGLIGSAIVDLLLWHNKINNANISIYVAARQEKVFDCKYKSFDNIYFVEYDALNTINFKFRPDYIIHCAGSASPELYTSSPVETILSNFNGVYNLLEFCKKNCVKRLLYVSSSEVYGNKLNEDAFVEYVYGNIDIDSIRSSYSVAKRASEMLCKSYSNEYNVNTVIVRPGHIFGPTASVNDKRISSSFPFKAARGEKLEMKSAGLQKRSYCYCLDCAVAILVALVRGKYGEAYNIGHNEITTIRTMAEIVAEAANVELITATPTEQELSSFNPMNNSSLNNEKIKELGYSDTFTVFEGLSHTVQILKEMI